MAVGRRWRITALQAALGVSVVAHAGLLAVRFADPSGLQRLFEDSPLEVVLVNARSSAAPEKAQAIAQVNLIGGGDAEAGRAASPLPPSPDLVGDASDDTRRRVEQLQEVQAQLLAELRLDPGLLPPREPTRDELRPEERDEEDRRRQRVEVFGSIEKRIRDENARPRKRFVSADTREEVYAMYYDQLRAKVEDRGTRNFPENQGKKLYGELMMVIVVDAEGRVLSTEIVRPSGSKLLDRRAVAIVQAAAPYGRFTNAMKNRADQLEITSRFRFSREDGVEATLGAPSYR